MKVPVIELQPVEAVKVNKDAKPAPSNQSLPKPLVVESQEMSVYISEIQQYVTGQRKRAPVRRKRAAEPVAA